MMLRRLEVSGFKSFAKRANLDFSAPITAIVGPNGSGKSNVVEAIRFVLGEQSVKSLRSKTGADLIFKGSKLLGKMSRASASLTFDNSTRVFQFPGEDGIMIPIDFDQITISREVFMDGTNRYAVNGEDVRLRDIHEMIGHLNIGSSGHHIISQGEADRLLSAKSPERKEMLEESLGLRLYHSRIRQSMQKLERTLEHMREADVMRRELVPQVKFLKKQVEKIERAEQIRNDLQTLFGLYQGEMESFLRREQGILVHSRSELSQKLEELGTTISSYNLDGALEQIRNRESLITDLRNRERVIRKDIEEMERHLGRVEGMIEASGVTEESPISETNSHDGKDIPFASVARFVEDLEGHLMRLEQDGASSGDIISAIRAQFTTWSETYLSLKQKPEIKARVDGALLLETKRDLETKRAALVLESEEISYAVIDHTKQIESLRATMRDDEKSYYGATGKRTELTQEFRLCDAKLADLQHMKTVFDDDVREAEALVGAIVPISPSELDKKSLSHLESMRHEIERLKIRLEDMGGGGGGDILAEYREAEEREAYLGGQIADLEKARVDLETLIRELREKLEKQFLSGLSKINAVFDEYFKLMFGGGTARLLVTKVEKRKKRDEEGEEIVDEEEGEAPLGVDIDVSLPRKKVKELEMLSGGERSLTSIALLFALSQVNPPPFLVLDETDAALDEANSRKYGDMIEKLAEETQLIVVTHNRETMSRAHILYGVTLGMDDSSTLLSVKFEEAVKVAK